MFSLEPSTTPPISKPMMAILEPFINIQSPVMQSSSSYQTAVQSSSFQTALSLIFILGIIGII